MTDTQSIQPEPAIKIVMARCDVGPALGLGRGAVTAINGVTETMMGDVAIEREISSIETLARHVAIAILGERRRLTQREMLFARRAGNVTRREMATRLGMDDGDLIEAAETNPDIRLSFTTEKLARKFLLYRIGRNPDDRDAAEAAISSLTDLKPSHGLPVASSYEIAHLEDGSPAWDRPVRVRQ